MSMLKPLILTFINSMTCIILIGLVIRLTRLLSAIRGLTKCRTLSHQIHSNSSGFVLRIVQCCSTRQVRSSHHSHSIPTSYKMDAKQMQKILDEFSTEKYFIEYGGYLSNHLPHCIIALQRLGATETRVRKFMDWYIPRLESSEKHSDDWKIPEITNGNTQTVNKKNGVGTEEQIKALIGKRCSYYAILQFYEQQLKGFSGDVDKLIQKWLPVIVAGFAGSALHGLIHMGYGYAAGNASSTQALHDSPQYLQSLGRGSEQITDILAEIAANVELKNHIRSRMSEQQYQTLETSDFQRSMRIIFTDKANELLDYIRRIKFPEHIDMSLPTQQHKQDLFKWLLDCSVTAYALCERKNDFFLIHGITAAFGMQQVTTALNVSEPSDKIAVLKCTTAYLYTLLAAYITQGAHKLVAFESGDVGRLESSSWGDIVTECLAEERDEHIYKLVQVCQELDNVTNNTSLKKIYKRAVSRAIEHPLVF